MTVMRHRLMRNFSAAAAEYDARAEFQHVETARVFDAAAMLLPADARIVDIGCGTGYFAQLASRAQKNWRITGIDIAPGMCALASAQCAVVQADAVALPMADASCQAVVSSLCLQWVEALPRALAEMYRVLQPGGRAIIATLGSQTLRELRGVAAEAELSLGMLPMREAQEYRWMISDAGFGVTLFEQKPGLEYYPTVGALLDSMRLIGAGNNFASGARGLTGAGRWKKMLARYESQRDRQGIPATWDRIFTILHKPL